MLVYLLIPVALAIVFFTMSFFQREAAVVNVAEKEKPKDKKPAKKTTGVKKPVQKKTEKEEQEKPISQKNFTEEIDIKELASMQGKIEKPSVKKEEKKEEKKAEVKEAVKEVAAAVDSKKKQKKSDWVTKEVKPQRVKPEETEEKKEEEKKTEKKDKRGDKKRGDKKGGDKKRGDKKEEEGEPKEKSIYKAFKPHGAEADKVEVKEEKKEEVAVEEEKKEKKEKKEKTDKPPQKPRLKMKYNAYKSSEDFWETNIADSYVEPAEITTVSPVPTEEKAEKKEKKEKGTPKKGESREPAPAVQIKVNRQVSLARTDPWAKTDSSAQAATSDSDDYFPALGEKGAKKPKKVNKASETEPTVGSPQKKSDSHKREANDTLFYNAEAPADKKIKLGEEADFKDEETFVLPSE